MFVVGILAVIDQNEVCRARSAEVIQCQKPSVDSEKGLTAYIARRDEVSSISPGTLKAFDSANLVSLS